MKSVARPSYINFHLKSEVSITLCFQLCSTQPVTACTVQIKNCLKTTSAIQVAIMKIMGGAAHPSYVNYQLKASEVSTTLLSAMFNSLHSSTNQHLLEKHF